MQKISVYLHEEIVEILKCFGSLNDVVNKALRECINTGKVFEHQIPSAPSREDARRLNLYIDDDVFEELNLSKLKVRPILYWFIDNEVYRELDWEISREYGADRKERANKLLRSILADLKKFSMLTNKNVESIIDEMEKIYYET